jgi:hypothetical protein
VEAEEGRGGTASPSMPLRAPFEPPTTPGGGEGEGGDWFLNGRSDGLASGALGGGSWRVERRGGEGEVEYLEREIQKVREEGRVKLETGVCVCVYVCV